VEATEPMSLDQAVDALVQPEEQPTEEVAEAEEVEETNSLSSEDDTEEPEEEQPEEDSDDEGEADEETDDDSDESGADESDEEDYEDGDDEDDSEDPDETLYTVKVDGEEKQVNLEELKRGYSGQQYVQLGMQKAAEAQKQAAQVNEILQQQTRHMDQLIQNIQAGALTPPVKPDPSLYDTDPMAYLDKSLEYDKAFEVYQQNLRQVQQQLQYKEQAEAEARAAYEQAERGKLHEAMPELQDPQKAQAFGKQIMQAAQEYGFSDEEIGNIQSHRELLVLRDAMRYRALQKKGDIVKEKSKKARKPIKPGAKKVVTKGQQYQKQRDKLRKSGTIDDALALIIDPNLR